MVMEMMPIAKAATLHPLQSLIKIHFDLSTFNIYQLHLSIFCYQ